MKKKWRYSFWFPYSRNSSFGQRNMYSKLTYLLGIWILNHVDWYNDTSILYLLLHFQCTLGMIIYNQSIDFILEMIFILWKHREILSMMQNGVAGKWHFWKVRMQWLTSGTCLKFLPFIIGWLTWMSFMESTEYHYIVMLRKLELWFHCSSIFDRVLFNSSLWK